LSLCLTKHHAMKTYWGSGGIAPLILWLRRWVVSFMHRPLYPRERAPGTHCIVGWVGPRAVLYAVMRKISSPRRESNPRTLIPQPVAQRYTDWAITALIITYKYYNLLFISICFSLWCHVGVSLASSVSGCVWVWVCVCLGLYAILVFSQVFNSCEVCSGWVTYCHRCLTCFKGLCVYSPR
jgi:hypothetical protein